jgi:hypothetical protein
MNPRLSPALALSGAALALIACFVDFLSSSEGSATSLIELSGGDRSFGFVGLEPVVASLVAAVLAAALVRRPRTWVSDALVSVGALSFVYFLGFFLFGWFESGLSPTVGLYVGLVGSLMVAAAGGLDVAGREGWIGARSRTPAVVGTTPEAPASVATGESAGLQPHPSPSLPPAGWYGDPSGQAAERYWDGGQWTTQVR